MMGFQSKRQQCCLLVLDAASSALLSEVSLVTHWVSLQRVGVGVRVRVGWGGLYWAGRGWIMHLCLCSPSSNAGCQTSAATPLYLCPIIGFSHSVSCCSGRNVSVSPVLRAVYSLLCNLTLVLQPFLLGPSGFNGTHNVLTTQAEDALGLQSV